MAATNAAQNHDTGNIYTLGNKERELFLTLGTTDECTAYINWALAQRNTDGQRKADGYHFIRRWLGRVKKNAIQAADRDQLVQDAADTRRRDGHPAFLGDHTLRFGPLRIPPPAIAVTVNDVDGSPLSPDVIPLRVDKGQGLEWRYLNSIHTRYSDPDALVSVRVYIGVDAAATLRDVSPIYLPRRRFGNNAHIY